MENAIESSKKQIYELITKSPGKVLLCGGYLIINPKYQGLVVTTKTYFESRGRFEILDKIQANDNLQTTFLIAINSKNFNQSFYYKADILFDKNEKEDLDLFLSINFEGLNMKDFEEKLGENFKSGDYSYRDNKNSSDKFIINTLKSAIYFLLLHHIRRMNHEEFRAKLRNKLMFINIDLDADYRFYGYERNLEQNNIAKNIKTGLGSSSALVSSLSANLILNISQYLNNIEIKTSLNDLDDEIKLCILLAANNANNQAQNKIGSGFDICSCLLGSQVFKRRLYDQKLNEYIDQSGAIIKRENIKLYNEMLMGLLEERYLENIVRIPKSFFETKKQFAIISIEIGTDTRSFVKKIMEYANKSKKNEIFDDHIFQELNKENEELIKYILNEG